MRASQAHMRGPGRALRAVRRAPITARCLRLGPDGGTVRGAAYVVGLHVCTLSRCTQPAPRRHGRPVRAPPSRERARPPRERARSPQQRPHPPCQGAQDAEEGEDAHVEARARACAAPSPSWRFVQEGGGGAARAGRRGGAAPPAMAERKLLSFGEVVLRTSDLVRGLPLGSRRLRGGRPAGRRRAHRGRAHRAAVQGLLGGAQFINDTVIAFFFVRCARVGPLTWRRCAVTGVARTRLRRGVSPPRGAFGGVLAGHVHGRERHRGHTHEHPGAREAGPGAARQQQQRGERFEWGKPLEVSVKARPLHAWGCVEPVSVLTSTVLMEQPPRVRRAAERVPSFRLDGTARRRPSCTPNWMGPCLKMARHALASAGGLERGTCEVVVRSRALVRCARERTQPNGYDCGVYAQAPCRLSDRSRARSPATKALRRRRRSVVQIRHAGRGGPLQTPRQERQPGGGGRAAHVEGRHRSEGVAATAGRAAGAHARGRVAGRGRSISAPLLANQSPRPISHGGPKAIA
eukprot:scaffold1035_cov374-Prasinococcus_capsulatus_cf.AAC.10